MKAIEEEWKAYRDTRGRPAEQTEECHTSFMAGAMTALMLMRVAGELEEPEARALIAALETEVTEYIAALRLEHGMGAI